jgi:hypothetical protein
VSQLTIISDKEQNYRSINQPTVQLPVEGLQQLFSSIVSDTTFSIKCLHTWVYEDTILISKIKFKDNTAMFYHQ